jgi:small subunit ribosomal protein S17
MTQGADQGNVEKQEKRRLQKERQGVVVAAKRQKTVTVAVHRRVKHARYGKFIDLEKRYSVHDTLGCQEGDIVLIRETRPISKTKRWRVVEKLKAHGAGADHKDGGANKAGA